MNIEELLNNQKYIKIQLVGNSYCSKRPSNNDIDVQLLLDYDNKYDRNAIKVVSIRNTKKYKLGYIKKNRTAFIRNILDKIKFKVIIKKAHSPQVYYYLIFESLIK